MAAGDYALQAKYGARCCIRRIRAALLRALTADRAGEAPRVDFGGSLRFTSLWDGRRDEEEADDCPRTR